MKKVLIVEDDATIARIYQGLLRMEGMEAEVASDGDMAVEYLGRFRPDLVLLDLMLPKRNGIQVLKHIRATAALSQLPVVVFTNAYMGSLMRDALQSGATHCLAKAQSRPKQVVQTLRGFLGLDAPAPGHEELPSSAMPAPALPGAAAQATAACGEHAQSAAQASVRQKLLEQVAPLLADMRSRLQVVAKTDHEAGRLSHWSGLCAKLDGLARESRAAGLGAMAQFAGALETLARESRSKTSEENASALRAIAQGLDCLDTLRAQAVHGPIMPAKRSMVLILDDDAVSRRLISSCIERVGLRCIALFDPNTALKVLLGNPFDLIFLDVDMPGTNGFELCKELRNSEANKTTPVIFVTSLTNLESRALSIMSGADDYVRKPFCPAELAVRALLHLLNPRSRATPPAAEPAKPTPAEAKTGSATPVMRDSLATGGRVHPPGLAHAAPGA